MMTGYTMAWALKLPKPGDALTTAQVALAKANQAIDLANTATRFVRTFDATVNGLLSATFGFNSITAGTLYEICISDLIGSSETFDATSSITVNVIAIDNNAQFMPLCIVQRGVATNTDRIFLRGIFVAGIANTAGNSAAGAVITAGGTLDLTVAQASFEVQIYNIVAESDINLWTA